MGRELRRKEAKRSGKNVKEAQEKNKENPLTLKTLTIIMIAVILLFVMTYLLTAIFATKDIKLFNNSKEDEESTNTISNRILASDSLKQAEGTYYVYYYDSTDENSEISDVIYRLDNTVYRVDLNNDFNSNFIGEPSGIVDSINDLKVSDPTIIKVSSGTITGFYNGVEEIKTLS